MKNKEENEEEWVKMDEKKSQEFAESFVRRAEARLEDSFYGLIRYFSYELR